MIILFCYLFKIFGRAGRPQYDTSGEGIIITSFDQVMLFLLISFDAVNNQLTTICVSCLNNQLPRYLALMTHQVSNKKSFLFCCHWRAIMISLFWTNKLNEWKMPIESRFIEHLADHLNAEIVLVREKFLLFFWFI